MNEKNRFLEAALFYARRLGWPVFPVKPGQKEPPLTSHGSKDATTDEGQIRAWWKKTPRANVAVRTGDEFFVVDVDFRHGGLDTVDALQHKHGRLRDTLRQTTGRQDGSYQLIYKRPPGDPIANAENACGWAGIDLRGTNGYILLPPSIHPISGKEYAWDTAKKTILEEPINPADEWLIEAIHAAQNGHRPGGYQLPKEKIPHGVQHKHLVSMAGKMRYAHAEYHEIVEALWQVNLKRCETPGPRENIEQYARSVCEYPPGTKPKDGPPREPEKKLAPPKPPGLPQDLHAERILLGFLLVGGAWREDVTARDFTDEQKQVVWRAMKRIRDAGDRLDQQRLILELGEKKSQHVDVAYVAGLGDGCSQEMQIEPYIRRLQDATVRRDILEHNNILTQHIRLGDRTADELIGMGRNTFEGLQRGRNHQEPPSAVPEWPEPLAPEAFHGIAGELVQLIEPHTEADPAALLAQFGVGWGSLIGRGPYYQAEADHHHTNEFVVIVGTTSKARKGTSWGRIASILGAIDQRWLETRLLSGLGSGEALFDAAGEEDRRTLVIEGEFARLLAVVAREGSTISANLRTAWDIGALSIRTRQSKIKVTGAHLSMIGHITREELLRRLDNTETANGFGNRIGWWCARRSKVLPHGGGDLKVGSDFLSRLKEAAQFARRMGNTRMQFDNEARQLWEAAYAGLSEGKPGLLGSMTSRAEAHTVRWALIYALLDSAEKIRVAHLRAALAVSRYCEDSARFIWGDALGDPTADGLLRALKAASAEGMTRWDITNFFGRNKSAAELDRAIGVLIERGLIRFAKEDSGGRPTIRYWAL